MYSLEYVLVVNIVIQAIGVVSGLLAIYDKIVKVYEDQKRKKDSTAPGDSATGGPVLIIEGKRYLLLELSREKIIELDTGTGQKLEIPNEPQKTPTKET
jgi:hypothetical protein